MSKEKDLQNSGNLVDEITNQNQSTISSWTQLERTVAQLATTMIAIRMAKKGSITWDKAHEMLEESKQLFNQNQ